MIVTKSILLSKQVLGVRGSMLKIIWTFNIPFTETLIKKYDETLQ